MTKYHHLSMQERITILSLHKQGFNQAAIADETGRSPPTISRELRKGAKPGARAGEYCPLHAHRRAKGRRAAASRAPKKLTAKVMKSYHSLMRRCMSLPLAASQLPVSQSALYNRAWRDACAGSHHNPPRPRRKKLSQAPHCYMAFGSGYYRKRRKHGRSAALRDCAPIAARPMEADLRLRAGHWEVDTMHWPEGRMSLTLYERKTREPRLALLPENSADAVAKCMRRLLRGKVVKTMTSDGGSEFARFRQLEKSLGVDWYVCAPGRPQQRGGVEQLNGQIRRMVVRGLREYKLAEAIRIAAKALQNRARLREKLRRRDPHANPHVLS